MTSFGSTTRYIDKLDGKIGGDFFGKMVGSGGISSKNEIWLGDLDSNQGCPVQSRKFYR